MEEKTHFSHYHPLNVFENIDHESLIFSCCFKGGCSPSDQVYGCVPCRYFIHRSCSEMPSEIHHFYHLGHVLRLCAQNTEQATCGACGNQYYGFSYRCTEEEEHSFNMDTECALLPDKLKLLGCDIDYVQHSSHGHPLVLCDDNETKEKLCSGCNKPCLGEIYGCLRCDIFLDEACLLLPHRIGHPFHPSHPLTLTFRDRFQCNGCKQTYHHRLSYNCSNSCDFNMDLECASLTPIIYFEGHDHLLTLFILKREYPDLDCSLCHKRSCYNLAFFRCVDCDYSLHLLCGPLPRTIKDKCHVDPLKLMDYFVEDGYQADDIYCDTCEQIRDPEECVYYCKDCNFVSEFKCVLPEVLHSLEGLRGNVQLRSANEINSWIRGKVISNLCEEDRINEAIEIVDSESDIEIDFIQKNYPETKFDQNPLGLHTFTGEEVDQVSQIFKRAGVNLRYIKYDAFPAEIMPPFRYIFNQLQSTIVDGSHRNEKANSDMDNDDVVEEDYKQFIEKLNSSSYVDDDYILNLLKVNYNVVMIGELMVIEELGSILKGLLYKHGDFTSKSKLNQIFKMIFTTIFCKVVHNMCITTIRDVDFVLLQKWWKSIKLVKYAGFEIQFMIDHLYKVVQASFELQKQVEVTKLQVQYDQITCKVEKLEEELKACKRDQEVIKSKLDEYKVLGYRRSPKIKECLEYASELKWKKAWNASPIMFRNFRYNQRRRRILRPQSVMSLEEEVNSLNF